MSYLIGAISAPFIIGFVIAILIVFLNLRKSYFAKYNKEMSNGGTAGRIIGLGILFGGILFLLSILGGSL